MFCLKMFSYYYYHLFLISLFLYFSQLVYVSSDAYGLRTLINPSGCIGGEVCQTQPIVAVIFATSEEIDYSYQGTMYVQIASRPDVYAELYIGYGCSLEDCGEKVTNTLASVDIVNGIATFDSLFFKTSGDYQLKFIGRDSSGNDFAQTICDSFTVYQGEQYKIIFHTYLGIATGGIPFSPNPVIAIVDRGDNIITDASDVIKVELTRSPTNQETLQSLNNIFQVDVMNGLATFDGLYLNRSGYPYELTFSSMKNDFEPLSTLLFDVSVGPAAKLHILNTTKPSASVKYAGEFFAIPPIVEILDIGGNRLVHDNTSGLEIQLNDNQSGGKLDTQVDPFVVVEGGLATFHAIRIDKLGVNYTFQFYYSSYSLQTSSFTLTNITLTSEKFPVVLGPPRQLRLTQLASKAWAGGEAFLQQPFLQLTDGGGNIVTTDWNSSVTVTAIPSLSISHDIMVDTRFAGTSSISTVVLKPIYDPISHLPRSSLSAGDVLSIIVRSPYNMWLRSANVSLPYIALNIQTLNTSNPPYAVLTSTSYDKVRSLTFEYLVQEGDSLDVTQSLWNSTSLELNSSVLFDGNDHAYNLTLPINNITDVSISTSAPQIVGYTVNQTAGVYSQGEVFVWTFTFDQPVFVFGHPYLLLNIYNKFRHAYVSANYYTTSSDRYNVSFVYIVQEGDECQGNSPNVTLLTNHTGILYAPVNETDITTHFNSTLYALTNETSYYYTYQNLFNLSSIGSIRRYSMFPTTHANLTLPSDLLQACETSHALAIDTNNPILDVSYGVQLLSVNGSGFGSGSIDANSTRIYYPGDYIYLGIRYNQPVVVLDSSSVKLAVDTGICRVTSALCPKSIADFGWLEADEQTLVFRYEVESYVNTSSFDIDTLTIPVLYRDISIFSRTALRLLSLDAKILRKSTHPTLAVNLTSQHITLPDYLLNHNLTVTLDGQKNYVTSIAINSTISNNATFLYPKDIVLVDVHFLKPVVLTCQPVLNLRLNYDRIANYYEGNLTNKLTFQYKVAVGDVSTNGLFYRNSPNALCTSARCLDFDSDCHIFSLSETPRLDVDLTLPKNLTISANKRLRKKVSSTTCLSSALHILPLSSNYQTNVTNISWASTSGEYAYGSVIELAVVFSDPVIVSFARQKDIPRIYLSNNRYASFIRGNYQADSTLIFAYIIQSNDTSTLPLEPQLLPHTMSPFHCNNSCSIVNLANRSVNLNYSDVYTNAHSQRVIDLSVSPIYLNSEIPQIVNIFLAANVSYSSFYQNNSMISSTDLIYSSDDIISVVVVYDRPVDVLGVAPRIQLSLYEHLYFPESYVNKSHDHYASYIRDKSNATFLVFDYLVEPGDYVLNNTLVLSPTIDCQEDRAYILRHANIPLVEANYSLSQYTFDSFVIQASEHEEMISSGLILPLTMNTTLIAPRITQITSLIDDGNYTTGDIISIRVTFSRPILAFGQSYLLLNMGNVFQQAVAVGFQNISDLHTSDFTEWDFLAPTPATNHLIYQYQIQENDFAWPLDYVDVFSLLLGQNYNHDASFIRLYAPNHVDKAYPAVLTLPLPGQTGSLSANSYLWIDGRPARMTNISFATSSGIYSVNDSIGIHISFNKPVVVLGTPALRMDIGQLQESYAYYDHGNETATLTFIYRPEPGDYSIDLDYYSNVLDLYNSSRGFVWLVDGQESDIPGTILTYSQHPIAKSFVHLNPIQGQLLGQTQLISDEGQFSYRNLQLTTPGINYLLSYSLRIGLDPSYPLLLADQYLSNSFSSETFLRPSSAWRRELVGSSLSLDGDLLAVGAPGFNKSVTSVQVFNISVSDGSPQHEVQVIITSISPRSSIVRFHSTANVGVTLGGTFTISIGNYGSTRKIPHNADKAILESIMLNDFGDIGNVTVSVESYIYCACNSAYTWVLTFNGINEGIFPGITLDASGLTGTGAGIPTPTILQSPSFLSGSFVLGLASGSTKITSSIPIDTTVDNLKERIQSDLGLPISDLTVTMTTVTNTRTWSITFDALNHYYDVPSMRIVSMDLSGGTSPSVYTTTTQNGRHSPDGIAGYFQLTWRGNTTTKLFPNSTALDVKDALEALPIIKQVNVERNTLTLVGGVTSHEWIVEFVKVQRHSNRGYETEQVYYAVEPLVPVNHLIATDPHIYVDTKYYLGDPTVYGRATRLGDFGDQSGAVFLYQRQNQSWHEITKITGNDTTTNSLFGTSVSLQGDILAVGSPGANDNGVPEIQAIHCHADSGYFTLSFRGFTTDPIPYNVNHTSLIAAIVSQNGFENLHSVEYIDIASWGSGGLCEGNHTAKITFYVPNDPFQNLTQSGLELLTPNNINLTLTSSNASLSVYEVQHGTIRVHGLNADPQQIGGVYLFEYRSDLLNVSSSYTSHNQSYYNYTTMKSVWLQTRKFTPLTSPVASRYGEEVLLINKLLLISAAGSFNEAGAVYIYESDATTNTYAFLQLLIQASIYDNYQSNFGEHITGFGNTLAIAAPGYINDTGTAFVYTRPDSGGVFTILQTLSPGSSYALSAGDNFGCAIAMKANMIVVSACNYADKLGTYSKKTNSWSSTQSGAVFVFTLKSGAIEYSLYQKLSPSNVQSYDHFGYELALSGSSLVVSASEDYLAKQNDSFLPAKAIFAIESTCSIPCTLSGHFQLTWRISNESFVPPTPRDRIATSIDYTLYTTRLIPYDISALLLSQIIEEDLHTGPVFVSRTPMDVYTRGYHWEVTFSQYFNQLSHDKEFLLSLFTADCSYLRGSNATVKVSEVQSPPQRLRQQVHYFHWHSTMAKFIEEVYLMPFRSQPADRFGASLTVDQSSAVVAIGAPNRDLESFPGHNSGGVYIYDLSFLSLQFVPSTGQSNNALTSYSYYSMNLLEGLTASYNVTVDTSHSYYQPHATLFYYFQTMVRNQPSFDLNTSFVDGVRSHRRPRISSANVLQTEEDMLATLYASTETSSRYYEETRIDKLHWLGRAMGIPEYYLNLPQANTSLWLEGVYDYLGAIDFTPTFERQSLRIDLHKEEQTMVVETNGDYLLEAIPESFLVGLWSPGIWPSPYGHFLFETTLLDQSTGLQYDKERFVEFIPREELDKINAEPIQYPINQTEGAGYGTQVVFHDEWGVLFVASPDYKSTSKPYKVGKISQYVKDASNISTWGLYTTNTLRSPVVNGSDYADSLALEVIMKRRTAILAVSEVSLHLIHIYESLSSDFTHHTMRYVTSLTLPSSTSTLQSYESGASKFSRHRTLTLYRGLLIVGSQDLESVFIYRRSFDQQADAWSWSTTPTTLQASDYDYDILQFDSSRVLVHTQGFGSSIAISERTLAIGAPFADYDNLGSPSLVENYRSEGTTIKAVAKGKVYLFYSYPSIITARLLADNPLQYGQFYFQYQQYNLTERTKSISLNESAEEIAAALMLLNNIDSVLVSLSRGYLNTSSSFAPSYEYLFTIVFIGEYVSQGNLTVHWASNLFSSTYDMFANVSSPSFAPNITFQTAVKQPFNATFFELIQIKSPDIQGGSQFGASIDIHDDLLVVGAPFSSALTLTSWDFETGTLEGWKTTGNAFDCQPTYGDNSRYHTTSQSLFQNINEFRFDVRSSQIHGRYYVSTYECRPGSAEDYTVPSSEHPAGNTQGGAPVGSLTSQVFHILGDSISFYLGGGCDINHLYVELSVDGMPVARQTAKCSFAMDFYQWDVSKYRNRAAHFTLVDNSTDASWGFISLDQVSFSWENNGQTIATSTKASYAGGREETTRSGQAFLFSNTGELIHHNATELTPKNYECYFNPQLPDYSEIPCFQWALTQRMMPSDKRSHALFGSHVLVDAINDLVVVSAPGSPSFGPAKNSLMNYPLNDILSFPAPSSYLASFESIPTFSLQTSSLNGLLDYANENNFYPDLLPSQEVGGVYFFARHNASYTFNGTLVSEASWPMIETARLQPIDGQNNDRFGSSMSLQDHSLVVGSPYHDIRPSDNLGSVYLYDLGFTSIRFSALVYPVLEGEQPVVTITLYRDSGFDFSRDIVLEYATSDLTARGVSEDYFAYCMTLPVQARASVHCGDYQQTRGIVRFLPGVTTAGFTVAIMNDHCYEPQMKFFQITLSLPGSNAIQGSRYMTMVRIDDDDFDHQSEICE